MADMVSQKSLGELIDARLFSPTLSWTAGGASDSVSYVGTTVDRQSFSSGSWPRTADIDIVYDATLAAGHTLTVNVQLTSSPSGATGSFVTNESWLSTVIATGPTGGGRVSGVYRVNTATQSGASANAPSGTPGVDLSACARFLRVNYTPHLSATGTDTAVAVALGVFGGFNQLPAPQI